METITNNSWNVHDRIIVSEAGLVEARHGSELLILVALRGTLSISPRQTMELIEIRVYWQGIMGVEQPGAALDSQSLTRSLPCRPPP